MRCHTSERCWAEAHCSHSTITLARRLAALSWDKEGFLLLSDSLQAKAAKENASMRGRKDSRMAKLWSLLVSSMETDGNLHEARQELQRIDHEASAVVEVYPSSEGSETVEISSEHSPLQKEGREPMVVSAATSTEVPLRQDVEGLLHIDSVPTIPYSVPVGIPSSFSDVAEAPEERRIENTDQSEVATNSTTPKSGSTRPQNAEVEKENGGQGDASLDLFILEHGASLSQEAHEDYGKGNESQRNASLDKAILEHGTSLSQEAQAKTPSLSRRTRAMEKEGAEAGKAGRGVQTRSSRKKAKGKKAPEANVSLVSTLVNGAGETESPGPRSRKSSKPHKDRGAVQRSLEEAQSLARAIEKETAELTQPSVSKAKRRKESSKSPDQEPMVVEGATTFTLSAKPPVKRVKSVRNLTSHSGRPLPSTFVGADRS